MKGKIVLLLLVITGGMIAAGGACAQGVKIGVSPVVFELTGNPGETITNQIKVFNSSEDATIGIEMIVEDISPSGEEGFVSIAPADTYTYSIASWVVFNEKEFILQPKEEKQVLFSIVIPENAEPGGHYGTVLAGSKAITGKEMTGTAIAARVGSLVLLSVPGEVKQELAVEEFTAPPYSEYGPIDFVVRLENKGTVHVKPTGYITITNWLGRKVGDVGFASRNVLPSAKRRFEASFDQKWLWAGKYTATLTGSYGSSNIPLSPVVITFWAFPWKFAAAALVLVLFFILTRKRWFAAFSILVKGDKKK